MLSSTTASSRASSALAAGAEVKLCCVHCDDTFHTARFLHLHIRQVHDRLPAHHCPHCRSPFGQVSDVDAHIRAEHSERRTYACDSCTCSFVSATLLALHVRDAHQTQPMLRHQSDCRNFSQVVRKCSMCAFQTTRHHVFVAHLELMHAVKVLPSPPAGNDGPYQAAERRTVGFISGTC